MTVLVAVADDHARDRVLDVGVELGSGLAQDLYVVHFVPDTSADADARRLRDEIRASLEDAEVGVTVGVEQLSHPGNRESTRVARELLDAAADVEITHVVLGHATTGLFETLFGGSTAHAVADEAELPVTVVPDPTR